MADIELVIDISEEDFSKAKEDSKHHMLDRVWDAVAHGTPLPKGHGKIVDIGKIDKDRIERDNPVICCQVNGEYIEAVSLDYLNGLPAIVDAEEKKESEAFHCGIEEFGGHAYNCNDCPNKCEEYYRWDKEMNK